MRQIIRCEGARDLCVFVDARSADFGAAAAATAFRRFLKSRRDGMPSEEVERTLQVLEAAILRTIDAFEQRDISSTLHIMAKTRHSPREQSLIPKLEQQAEAVAGTFDSQSVANTLWAYATMGRTPGAQMMMVLEGRAEAVAGTMNAQNVSNTLWAYATMGREPRAGMMRVLEGRAEAVAGTKNAQAVANTQLPAQQAQESPWTHEYSKTHAKCYW